VPLSGAGLSADSVRVAMCPDRLSGHKCKQEAGAATRSRGGVISDGWVN